MLVTVENQTARIINTPDVINNNLTGGPADLLATGGNVTDPLPYPFDLVGPLAANGASGDDVQRAMHPRDFRRQHVMNRALEPAVEWNQIIQAGVVTFAIAAETAATDTEELFVAAV
jgi:hypothetical protein